MIVEIDHPVRGKVKIPGFAPRMSRNHIEYEPSAGLGENNLEVYQGILGLSSGEIEQLKKKKVI